MKHRLYELFWEVVTDVNCFYYREFKVFDSEETARRYGRKRERELNGGLSLVQRAEDGYYFKFRGTLEVAEIDGFAINLQRGAEGQR